MVNKQLKEALLNKLRITPQALSQRCQQLKTQIPMSTEDAVYIIAQQNGIRLDKYLNEEKINQVRILLQQLSSQSPSTSVKTRKQDDKHIAKSYVFRIGKDFRLTDPILPRKKLVEASEMSGVFPYIYVLENSIREFIDKIMTTKFGADWWDSQAPPELKKDVSKKMATDKKDSWHQRRGDRPIDYLDLIELPRVMNKIGQFVVPDIIPSLEWFRELVKEVYKSRCVVCHMNPLEKNNADAVMVRFIQWEKLIDANKDLILKLSS